MEFQSRSRRPRGGCWGNNGQGHLSCVAALPFAYNRSGGPASAVFHFSPLLSGDTSVPYNGPFVPSRFLPTFNPSKLLLFRPLLSVSARKQNLFETATIHLPPSASVCHYDFLALSLAVRYALCMSVSKPSLKASGKLAEDGNDGLQIGMK